MYFLPYLGCVWLGVDSLRGGLAEGNRIFETTFFDILTIHHNQLSYVKCVSDPVHVYFTPLVVHLHVVRLFELSHNLHVSAQGGPS